MKTLFDSFKIGNLELKNRLYRSATWENMADEEGHITPRLRKVYEDLAKGEAGLIITSGAFFLKNSKGVQGQIGFIDDSYIDEYRDLTNMIHQYNSKTIIELSFIGSNINRINGEIESWGPSAIANIQTGNIPKELSKEDIASIVEAMAHAGDRAKKAGFDGVQIHGAHGYAFSRFLSPYYNKRTDEYGGSLENRARIFIEAYSALREKTGKDFPIILKINANDFMDEGSGIEECKYVCVELAKRGLDAVEISGPREVNEVSGYTESIFRDYAAEICELIDIPVMLIKSNFSPDVLEHILNSTKIELFGLSRPLLRESNLIQRWANGDKSKSKCIGCFKCFNDDGNECIFVKGKRV